MIKIYLSLFSVSVFDYLLHPSRNFLMSVIPDPEKDVRLLKDIPALVEIVESV